MAAPVKTGAAGDAERPCIYLPLLGAEHPDPLAFGLTLAIHTAGNPALLAEPVRRAIRGLEPQLALSNVRTMGEHLAPSLAGTRVLRTLLYGIEPNDAVSFVTVPLIVLGISLLAAYIPARRAARVDPLPVLRSD